MERSQAATPPSRSSLRWAILRQAITGRASPSVNDHSIERCTKDVSRKTPGGFKLISCCPLNGELHSQKNKCQFGTNELSVCYTLPVDGDKELIMIRRSDDCIDLDDFKISNKYDIDTTGLVYVQRNININASTFGDTEVKSMILHWIEELDSEMLYNFDIIIASDCTFFKEVHECLAKTVKSLLKNSETSEAIFLSPKRGDSLDKFLVKIKDMGLDYDLIEDYDSKVWNLHQKFRNENDTSWPNYDEDHCYPFLLRITLQKPKTTSTTKP